MPATYEPIAKYTVSSSQSSYTFSSIPSTYTDLIIIVSGTSSSDISYRLQFNSDTGSNYSFTYLYGDGSSATSGRQTNQAFIGGMARTGTTQGNGIIHIMNYSNTTTYKTAIGTGGTAAVLIIENVGTWRSTSAINSMTLITESGTVSTGSTFTLYGIKAA